MTFSPCVLDRLGTSGLRPVSCQEDVLSSGQAPHPPSSLGPPGGRWGWGGLDLSRPPSRCWVLCPCPPTQLPPPPTPLSRTSRTQGTEAPDQHLGFFQAAVGAAAPGNKGWGRRGEVGRRERKGLNILGGPLHEGPPCLSPGLPVLRGWGGHGGATGETAGISSVLALPPACPSSWASGWEGC